MKHEIETGFDWTTGKLIWPFNFVSSYWKRCEPCDNAIANATIPMIWKTKS